METITFRSNRCTPGATQRLELSGQRLLVGTADTGIFRIAGEPRRATRREPAVRAPRCVGLGDDGLAPAAIAIEAPLAIVEHGGRTGPRDRHMAKVRAASRRP